MKSSKYTYVLKNLSITNIEAKWKIINKSLNDFNEDTEETYKQVRRNMSIEEGN